MSNFLLTLSVRTTLAASLIVLCGGSSASLAQIPGVEDFMDPQSGLVCNVVNATNTRLAVSSASGEEPRRLILIGGTDTILQSSVVDQAGNVFFDQVGFGSIRFIGEGEDSRLWYLDAVGNVYRINSTTLLPETTDSAPGDLPLGACDACEFWDNQEDCPEPEPVETEIVTQPVGGNACVDDRVSLFVEAIGDNIASYQWYKNDVALVGQTGPIFTIDKARAVDTAAYNVEVIDEDGSKITSDYAIVAIHPDCATEPPPTLDLCGSGAAMISLVTFFGLVGVKAGRRTRRRT